MNNLRILLIEDNPDHAELIEDQCISAFPDCSVMVRARLQDGLALLDPEDTDACPGLALIDLNLPDSGISQTIACLTELNTGVPLVVLTSMVDSDVSTSLIQCGIQDYLPKDDLNPALLERVCRYAVERKKRQLALEQQMEVQRIFCESLSHDFKAPLRNIRQLAGVLADSLEQKQVMDREDSHAIQLLQQRAGDLETLVDGLYQYLAVDAMETTVVSTDLNDIFARALSHLKQLDGNGSRTLTATELPEVVGQPDALFILFVNLLGNALKYSAEDTEVRVASYPEKNGYMIRFSDQGVGIPEQYHKKVFQPFQRIFNSTHKPGTGLGLAIVQKIVNRHNGRISVASQPGKGSCISVWLPGVN